MRKRYRTEALDRGHVMELCRRVEATSVTALAESLGLSRATLAKAMRGEAMRPASARYLGSCLAGPAPEASTAPAAQAA